MNDLSLRALARKVGVSQTAPYRHFEDKNDLIAVLKEEGLRKLGDSMRDLLITEKDPILRLQKLGLTYVEFAEKYPAHFKVMFEYELCDYEKYEALHEVSDNSFLCLQQTVNECLALPNARKIEPSIAQFGAWSMVHGLSVLLLNQSLLERMRAGNFSDLGDRNQIAEQVTKSFCDSLVNSIL
ncbi:MAG: TetR/AcrR family transcriptional regulator [Emcibacter sp.]|nr:TetR/AcrR family transcriptional regulator [Emcibacter sp.]